MSDSFQPAHFAQYLGVRLAATVFQCFPIEWNLRTARAIGWVWFHVLSKLPGLSRHRQRIIDNIRLAYGDTFDDAELRRMALYSMQNLVMLSVEVILTPRLLSPWTWRRYVELDDLSAAARELLNKRGCIMLTAHYGSFELLGYALAMAGFPITAIMRPFDNEYMTEFLVSRRSKSGLKLIYKKGAMNDAPKVLDDGGALCFIADQDAGRKGVFVDFFGRKASTYKSISLLAMDRNVPIIVGCARRIGRGFRYHICVNRIIQPEEWANRDNEMQWITQEFSTAMEEFIRVSPEQYWWIHRRWKSQPKERKKKTATNGAAADAAMESDAEVESGASE